jgi:hypothetical protein
MTVQRDSTASVMCRHLWQTCEAGTTEAPPPRKLNTWRRSPQPGDQPQLTPQDVDLLQDAVEEEFLFCELGRTIR